MPVTAPYVVPGQYDWSMSRTQEGHRIYKIKFKVLADKLSGPASILVAEGLPQVGSYWLFDDDVDVWAFCSPECTITPKVTEGPNTVWTVEQTFTTAVPANKRCQDTTINSPLDEPMKISGSFVKYTKAGIYDKDGNIMASSSHELFRGAQAEFDFNRPTVRIEQNVLNLGLNSFASMVDGVNSSPMWGLPARCIKLSNVSWSRLVYGSCTYYYSRTFDFDIDYNTFDREVVDEGTKVLNGKWNSSGEWELVNIDGGAPDPNNPAHFIACTDKQGNIMESVLLDGAGKPLNVSLNGDTVTPFKKTLKYYKPQNFFSLGVPVSL